MCDWTYQFFLSISLIFFRITVQRWLTKPVPVLLLNVWILVFEIINSFNSPYTVISYTNRSRCGKPKMWKISFDSAQHLWPWCAFSIYARKCNFLSFYKHFCPRRLIELQVSIFLAHLSAIWRDRENKPRCEMPEQVVLMKSGGFVFDKH